MIEESYDGAGASRAAGWNEAVFLFILHPFYLTGIASID